MIEVNIYIYSIINEKERFKLFKENFIKAEKIHGKNKNVKAGAFSQCSSFNQHNT